MRKLIRSKNLLLCISFVSLTAIAQNNPIQSQGNTQWKINGNIVDETNYIGTKNNFPLKFRSNDVERLRITSDGLIGIGTLLPQAQLDVYGNVIFRNNFTMANLVLESNLGSKDIILTDGEGKITKGDLNQLIHEVYLPNRACREDQNGNIPSPSWANGVNKLFTACDQVNVGIGTENPNFKLHVMGTTYSNAYKGASSYLSYRMVIGSMDENSSSFGKLFVKNVTTGAGIMIEQTGTNNYSKIIYADIQNPTTEIIKVQNTQLNYTPFLLSSSGKMEIHNGVKKIFQLETDGLIRARKIRLDHDSWADFVFDTSYKLMPLTDLKAYILENNHLPEVPSEKEVMANGTDLAEMNKVLLQKIEELTLYLINQNEKVDALAEEINLLNQKIKEIKN